MRVLALDTSTELGSVALLVDGELAAELHARVRARHGETLLPLVGHALALTGLARREIDLVAVGIGPGSFTGTRIGVATAKGLAVALDRPLVGVVSLRALAEAAPGRFVAPIVDAHKGEVYVALYEREDGALVERLAPIHAEPEQAAQRARAAVPEGRDLVVCGSGLRRYPEATLAALRPSRVMSPLWDIPRASIVALEGQARFLAGERDDRAALEPLYVRASDAVLPPDAGPIDER